MFSPRTWKIIGYSGSAVIWTMNILIKKHYEKKVKKYESDFRRKSDK